MVWWNIDYILFFQISSLLSEKAQAKQYKTLLEGLQHEKKQLETKVREMQKTVAQSQVNANSDGKLETEKTVQFCKHTQSGGWVYVAELEYPTVTYATIVQCLNCI